jgi:hypothetical protein
MDQDGMVSWLTIELTDAGGQWRPNWKLTRPARGRSSDFVSLPLHVLNHLTTHTPVELPQESGDC